ncbi:FG-GAP repeat protein [Kineosporia sp. R_H_3]|uniref:FG-GAP repeat protein n=1 Tax=Kineosporia sp. R_H_3 TaxID=1961848 RepID=UPI000B4AD2B5|nr:FG-GAP repeat protein [Kineosporia sp. R_H_3]
MSRSSRSGATTLRLLAAAALAAPALLSAVAVAPAARALIGTCTVPEVPRPFDLTGDLLNDWAVGEPGRGADEGAVHVVSRVGTVFHDLRLVQGAPVLPGGATVPGTSEAGDRFGAATAIGDFDGDGCGDLAIGAPGENGGRGSVTILFGNASVPNRVFGESSFSGATARPGEQFGAVLLTAELDGDARTDLVIGAFGERVTSTGTEQGGFAVVTGAQLAARTATFPQPVVSAASAGVPGTPENGDRFGRALATGDFDGDGDDDLAVGVPGENAGRGAVVVLSNPGGGIRAPFTARAFDQDSPGVPGTAEPGDLFGAALAAGDVGFPGVFTEDLAVGAPGENASAGSVTFVPGTAAGPTGAGSTVVTQATRGVAGAPAPGDRFGAALLVAAFDEKSSRNSVVIGAPGDVVSGHAGAGSVTFLEESATGPTPLPDLTIVGTFTQDSARVPGTAEAGDGFGSTLSGHGGATDWSLLIGVPGEDLGGVAGAGAVNWFDGSDGGGASPLGTTLVEADTPGIVGVRDTGGRFGAALDG